LKAEPEEGAKLGAFLWAVTSRPAGSTADLSANDDEVVTFRPDVAGVYEFSLVPYNLAMVAGETVYKKITVAKYAGAGVFNTHSSAKPVAPKCGTSYCHGGNNANTDLNVTADWKKSKHAQKLQTHLKGDYGAYYATSCLPCHVTGFDENPAADNGGFDDAARLAGFDLNQIPALVADAAANDVDNFAQLPAEVQNMSSIQCESCHGPGSLHPQKLKEDGRGIAGVNLDQKQCAQCHDSASGFQQGFYQWSASSHPITAEIDEGYVAQTASCLKCHTGEGFVDVQIDGKAPVVIPDAHGVTCATCHDPHYTENPNQLRVTGDYTLPAGQTFANAGKGGLCMHCHNSRVTNWITTPFTSSRGAHYGPQADMLLGVNGWAYNLPMEEIAVHSIVVEETCVHCHMADPTAAGAGILEPPLVGAHTYSMRDTLGTDEQMDDILNTQNACAPCHNLSTYDRTARGDYDGDGFVEGIQSETRGLFDILRPGILANMPGTSVNENGRIAISSANFAKLLPIQKAAIYNYNFVWSDGSFGVHNAGYAIQLLQRAYWGVYQRSIDEDYPDMDLRGPVIRNNADPLWMMYE
jgi:predicted CXXCH cytochrome family protein